MKKNIFNLLSCFFLLSALLFPASNLRRRAMSSAHSFCGTYPGRVHDELRKARNVQHITKNRRPTAAIEAPSGTTQDLNNLAVIEDDGTIVAPANPFDLSNLDLKMAPSGSNAYVVSRQTATVNQDFGTKLTLTDDDTAQISFPANFKFPFFGTSYTSIFINSDGNVTFGQGDAEHTERDLIRLNGGPPRIAPLLNDFDPSLGQGGIYYNPLADRFLVTWHQIQEFGGTSASTFQLALFPNGFIEFTYGAMAVELGVVGWSGGGDQNAVTLVNFSNLTSTAVSGPTGERFSKETDIDFTALAKKFYQRHPDDYDQLAIYTNFPYAIGGDTFAYEVTIKNDIAGINQDTFDFSQDFGSNGRLQSFLALNQLAVFPDDPDANAVRTYSAVEVVAHESAHRWLAYPSFKSGNTTSLDLLGYQQAHWSFFFNADASVMEGHAIRDNGNGTFTITAATNRYGKLDQYLMGLRNAADVGPLFYVQPPTGTSFSATDVTEPSDIGLTLSGTRKDLTVQDIIAAAGSRVPDVSVAPKSFHQAAILLVLKGTIASASELTKVNRIQSRLQEFFTQASDGLGAIDVSLQSQPVVPVISSLTPTSGSTLGGTRVYISGTDFQDGATVSFGGIAASTIQWVSPSLIVAVSPPRAAGSVDITITNPGASPATGSNAFSYRQLSSAVVSGNALRLPYVVDNIDFRSNLGINNPSTVAANVHILSLDNHGLLLSDMQVSVPANGFVQINSPLRTLEATSGITGREGALVLESDQPIQAFVSQIDNQSGDPSILEGVRNGASGLILQSAANIGSFRSNLIISNLSPTAALVNVRGLDRNTGQPVGTPLQNLSIPANGFTSFENILATLAIGSTFGPVEIRSTNGALLAASSLVSGLGTHTSGFFVAQPEDAGSMSEIIPFAIDNNAFRTNLGLNNLGTNTASVNIAFIGADGAIQAQTSSPIQVASLGLVQINGILRFLLGSSVATEQQGYLKITSNQPVKAFATQIDNISLDPSIETSVATGGTHLLLQSSANTAFQSSLAIINPNGAPTAVTLTARDGSTASNGTIKGTKTLVIPANGYVFTENVLAYMGANALFGPIELQSTAGLPVIAVSRVYNPAGKSSGFFMIQSVP